MKKIISLLLSFSFLMLFVSISTAQSGSIEKPQIKISPEQAGNIIDSTDIPEILQKPVHADSINPGEMDLFARFNAGWKYKETKLKKDKNGYLKSLSIKAEKLDKSPLTDSLRISEVFFLSDLSDSLTNWVEITNISASKVNLKNFMLETTKGNFIINDEIKIEPQKCLVLKDTAGLIFNKTKGHIILADSDNAIISSFSWDSEIMNFPADSLFSLEIIDVLKKSENPDNWNIIYGKGRAGYLPVKYAENMQQDSIWPWLKFVSWAAAGLIFILIIILTFRKRKKSKT